MPVRKAPGRSPTTGTMQAAGRHIEKLEQSSSYKSSTGSAGMEELGSLRARLCLGCGVHASPARERRRLRARQDPWSLPGIGGLGFADTLEGEHHVGAALAYLQPGALCSSTGVHAGYQPSSTLHGKRDCEMPTHRGPSATARRARSIRQLGEPPEEPEAEPAAIRSTRRKWPTRRAPPTPRDAGVPREENHGVSGASRVGATGSVAIPLPSS
jgi:hypothetical protein